MRNKWILIFLLAVGCAGTKPPPVDPPVPPDSVRTFSGTVFWDANPLSDSVITYSVYQGTEPKEYTRKADTPDTSMTFDDLLRDLTYYSAVTATNRHGESGFSNEVSLEGDQVPPDTTAPPVVDTLYARDIEGAPIVFKEFWGAPPVELNDFVIEVDKDESFFFSVDVADIKAVKVMTLDGADDNEIIRVGGNEIILSANTDNPVTIVFELDNWMGDLPIQLIAARRERLRVHYLVFETE